MPWQSPLFDPEPTEPASAPPAEENPPPDTEPAPRELGQSDYDRLVEKANSASRLEEENRKLQENWNHTLNLLRTGVPPEEVEKSIRFVMEQAGYDSSDVEEYLGQIRSLPNPAIAAPEESMSTPTPTPTPTPDETTYLDENKDGVGDPELVQRVDAIAKEQETQRMSQLRGMLDRSVSSAFQSNKDIISLIKRFSEKPEDMERSARTFFNEMKRETLDRLRIRRYNHNNSWNDSWIEEEAVAAGKATMEKFRSVIGDPSRLGRIPETDTGGGDRFEQMKPVPPPEYEPGLRPDQAQTKARDFAADQLLRAIHTEGSEGSRA